MKKNPLSLLLKEKEAVYAFANEPQHWNRLSLQFLLVSLVSLALFGVVVATYYPTWEHVFATSWKMIALVWGSIIICTPSLFVFSAIRGSNLKIAELVYLILGALATTGIVLLALTPITWFFTWTTDSIDFIRTMNGFVVGVAMLFGLIFLSKGIIAVHLLKLGVSKQLPDAKSSASEAARTNEDTSVTTTDILRRAVSKRSSAAQKNQDRHTEKPAVDVLALWFILFLIVMVQMAQKLGPWYDVFSPTINSM